METVSGTIILFHPAYIDLSEKLRAELELKIERLHEQDHFRLYAAGRMARFRHAAKNDQLCAYLLNRIPKECVLSGKLLRGVKTWFSMYYDDRLSVIDKFRSCYRSVMQPERVNGRPVATIAFCKFLISDLLGILAESRWQNLTDNAHQNISTG